MRRSFSVRIFFQEFAGGFVVGVLGYEQAADGELEDGLLQGVDGFGAVAAGGRSGWPARCQLFASPVGFERVA
jgi:hypothetical protein